MKAYAEQDVGGEDLDWTEMGPGDEGYDDDASDGDDFEQEALDDLAALKVRRSRLRAFADRLLGAVETIDLPETFLEAERSARAVRASDLMLVQIYKTATPDMAQPQPVQSHSRTRAPAKASSRYDDDEEPVATAEDMRRMEESKRAGLLDLLANMFGINEARLIMLEPLNRHANVEARVKGVWPHGEPYVGPDPEYWVPSMRVQGPFPNPKDIIELPCPGYADWIVHRVPKPVGESP